MVRGSFLFVSFFVFSFMSFFALSLRSTGKRNIESTLRPTIQQYSKTTICRHQRDQNSPPSTLPKWDSRFSACNIKKSQHWPNRRELCQPGKLPDIHHTVATSGYPGGGKYPEEDDLSPWAGVMPKTCQCVRSPGDALDDSTAAVL